MLIRPSHDFRGCTTYRSFVKLEHSFVQCIKKIHDVIDHVIQLKTAHLTEDLP